MKKTLMLFLTVFVVVLSTFVYLYSFETVSGTSMLPTYNPEDLVIMNKQQEPKRNDIVIIYSKYIEKTLIKRVIGVAGDVIEIRDGHLFRNGKLVRESYINEQKWIGNCDELTVKTGEVYVLGDNRNASTDSRDLGCLTTNQVRGVVVFNLTEKTGIQFKHLMCVIIGLMTLLTVIYIIIMVSSKKDSAQVNDVDTDLNNNMV